MPNCLQDFLKGQDQFGSGVSLNYRGGSGYGTITGGILSCITSLFFLAFIGVQLYTWLF